MKANANKERRDDKNLFENPLARVHLFDLFETHLEQPMPPTFICRSYAIDDYIYGTEAVVGAVQSLGMEAFTKMP